MDNVLEPKISSTEPLVADQQQPNMPNSNDKPLLRSFTQTNQSGAAKKINPIFALLVVVILGGVATGWAIAKVETSPNTNEKSAVTDDKLTSGEAGISDESMFEKDTPEGTLVLGGLDGEGTHHLDRNAGTDKMVYLTSSVIDLDSFVGKKVRIWGNTIAAQKAPWLMDVGKIKVVD